MPEITLSDAQYDALERVRADVEDAFVDGYGHARTVDAIDYLLDTYTPPAERDAVADAAHFERLAEAAFADLQRVAADVEEIPGSGIDADEMRGKLLAELGATELADRLAAQAPEDTAAVDGDDATPADDTTAPADDAERPGAPEADETDTERDAPGDSDEADEATEGGGGPDVDPMAAAGGALAAANQLLRQHEDRWRQTDGGEAPYEVDLPDGTTEGVRTKDDVRQLLFKHY